MLTSLTLIELPRLRLSFEVRGPPCGPAPGGHSAFLGDTEDVPRLYCREHASFYISNTPSRGVQADGLPHAVVLGG